MSKLYPPYIDGTIPAFSGTTLVVPFSMNKAVSRSEVAGFQVKIKTVSGIEVETASTKTANNSEVNFVLSENYNIGQYYKIQLAYINQNEEIGYFSTVGVVKYTTEPIVTIQGLEASGFNEHQYDYVGSYSQEGKDSTEKLYSSRFIVKDINKNIIIDSGEILHIVGNDDKNYEGIESFTISRDFPKGEYYFIQFITTSTNGIVKSSPNYKITQYNSLDTYITNDLIATMNFDEGYIQLTLGSEGLKAITGNFAISRAKITDIYNWEIIKYINVQNLLVEDFVINDFTIEQGVTYVYSIQQFNTFDVYSNRLLSNEIYSDFEDVFLFDGERQLKVRYNPKIATFKNDILDTKTDTIGSKYPFITRNGHVNYKEFSLAGLISFNMDEAKLFYDCHDFWKDYNRESTESSFSGRLYSDTALIAQNIYDERIFKNEVLNWLSNGEPKLLRTATEGNYLVRLMNISLSPNDTLGRMIHSFTCTAYEIGETDINTLNSFNIIDNTNNLLENTKQYIKSIVISTDNLNSYTLDSTNNWYLLNENINGQINYIKFTDLIPGTKIRIDNNVIMIGATGTYIYKSDTAISSIEIEKNAITSGLVSTLECAYETSEPVQYTCSVFDVLKNIAIKAVPLRQFIGEIKNIDDEDSHLYREITDARTALSSVKFIRAYKRPIYDIFLSIDKNNKKQYYEDMYCKDEITKFEEYGLYRVRVNINSELNYKDYTGKTSIYQGYYLDAMTDTLCPYFIEDESKGYMLLDGRTINTDNEITYSYIPDYADNIFNFYYYNTKEEYENRETNTYGIINLYEKDFFEIKNDILEAYINAGPGVITEISYLKINIEYGFPQTIIDLVKENYGSSLTAMWNKYTNKLKNVIENAEYSTEDIKEVKELYNLYIKMLNTAFELYKQEYGIDLTNISNLLNNKEAE